jgi:hypothetical protein
MRTGFVNNVKTFRADTGEKVVEVSREAREVFATFHAEPAEDLPVKPMDNLAQGDNQAQTEGQTDDQPVQN